MKRSLKTIAALFTIHSLCFCVNVEAAKDEADSITSMIEQLGDKQYSVRHRAELQLIELGTAAFDQLLAAEHHSDLEVASRASYILPRLRIRWVREDDLPPVRELMQTYDKLSKTERQEIIGQLATLDDDLGLGPLCRIARYDASPTTSRDAALNVLSTLKVSVDRLNQRIDVVERETGGSTRVPVRWIQRHIGRSQPSADAKNDWLRLVDAEIALHKNGSDQTNVGIVFRLLKYTLIEFRQSAGQELAFEPLRRMIDLRVEEGGDYHNAIVFALSWCTENEQWQALKKIEDRYAKQLREDRLLLYMVAESASRQGDSQRAKDIAERAYQLESQDIRQRTGVASTIAELGHHDWAEREWQLVIDRLPLDDWTSFSARRDLANMRLFDRGEYQKAADLLEEALSAISENKELKNKFATKGGRLWLGRYRALKDYFLACQEESRGNFQQQRNFLESAYQGNKENPDILIAMYRLQGADEAYKKLTKKRIQTLAKMLEDEIEANPNMPFHYNHWAWLISNTEGDFKKAVAYSLRSLEVKPDDPRVLGDLAVCYREMRALDLMADSPSYLDTLGRCYYAAGDLENAIKYQRQAIRRHPHLAVMHRQLDLFEQELATQNTK